MNGRGDTTPRTHGPLLQSLFGVLLAVALLAWMDLAGGFNGVHRWFHDQMLRGLDEKPSPDIVIVAIDERSLAELGRWPWPRTYHATLIQRLSAEAPRAIGLDILFTESDPLRADEDHALAVALARSGLVSLPVMMQVVDGEPRIARPLPELERHAANLGHVHLPVDSDGLVRRIFLREGQPDAMWDHFAVTVLQRAGMMPRPRPPSLGKRASQTSVEGWQRLSPMQIAFNGPPETFTRVSYVDVVRGDTPSGFFRDKLVLIGPTAAGLGDLFATPVTRDNTLMPGVELHANILDGLLRGRAMTEASAAMQFFFSLMAVTVAIMGAGRLGPLTLLVWYAAIGSGAVAVAWLIASGGIQLSPLSVLVVLATLYLLYVWRQWISTNDILSQEILRFRGTSEQELWPKPLGVAPSELVYSRVQTLRSVAQQLRDVHRFVMDSLEAVPDATLVCDATGRVRLANAEAFNVANSLGVVGSEQTATPSEDRRRRPGDALRGMQVAQLLSKLAFPNESPLTAYERLFNDSQGVVNLNATCQRGHRYLIKAVPTHTSRNEHTGWILSLIDVTAVHDAQQQRDEALGFMSHDMRSPQTAILSLLELRRQRPSALNAEQFEERVERHARRALALADGFIQLASAQTKAYQLSEHDLVLLVRDCVDDFWEDSQQRGIPISMETALEQAHAMVDREHFSRAVSNLISNALKYSASGTTLEIQVLAEATHWVVCVQDHGPGISQEAQTHLFEPFFRDPSAHRTSGVGLGLPFVQTVMRRHGGEVRLHSQLGSGSRFELWLPR